MNDIRMPNISGKTEREQIAQVTNYLFYLAQELNWALQTLSRASEEQKYKEEKNHGG